MVIVTLIGVGYGGVMVEVEISIMESFLVWFPKAVKSLDMIGLLCRKTLGADKWASLVIGI